MKTWFKVLALVALASMIIVGCSKGGIGKGTMFTPEKAKLFVADPTLKTLWDTGEAAMKTNDYYTANVVLRKLVSQPNLSADQNAAIVDTMTTLNEQLSKRLKAGDSDAQRSQQLLGKAGG